MVKQLGTPQFQRWFHGVATVVWMGLLVASVKWWSTSVPWLVAMSAYANLVGHWSSFQAAKAEEASWEHP